MEGVSVESGQLRESKAWRGFEPGRWQAAIDVRDFIVRNVTPYDGDESFLVGPSARTTGCLGQACSPTSRRNGAKACWTSTPRRRRPCSPMRPARSIATTRSSSACRPISRSAVRSFPFGGLRMVEAGLKAAGFEPDPAVHQAFTHYRKTHNDGVFDAYTPEIMRCRRSGIITGLPDVVWPRPHHRRLPPRGALWRRPADRGRSARSARRSTTCGRPRR